MHGGLHRPARHAAFALRGLPAAMSGNARRPERTGMARPVHAEIALEAALLPPRRVERPRCGVRRTFRAEPWAPFTTGPALDVATTLPKASSSIRAT